jgi:hypothetical protein
MTAVISATAPPSAVTRQVRLDMLCPGDIVRVQGERAAEVQHAAHDPGASVKVTYIECKSGTEGTLSGLGEVPVTLLRSTGMRAA